MWPILRRPKQQAGGGGGASIRKGALPNKTKKGEFTKIQGNEMELCPNQRRGNEIKARATPVHKREHEKGGNTGHRGKGVSNANFHAYAEMLTH